MLHNNNSNGSSTTQSGANQSSNNNNGSSNNLLSRSSNNLANMMNNSSNERNINSNSGARPSTTPGNIESSNNKTPQIANHLKTEVIPAASRVNLPVVMDFIIECFCSHWQSIVRNGKISCYDPSLIYSNFNVCFVW